MSKKKFNLELKYKINPFKKSINVDSDKSISIRSFLIGSISENVSTVKNVLESEDVLSTIKCLKKLGVVIKKKKSKYYQIYGKGLGSLAIKKNSTLNYYEKVNQLNYFLFNFLYRFFSKGTRFRSILR